MIIDELLTHLIGTLLAQTWPVSDEQASGAPPCFLSRRLHFTVQSRCFQFDKVKEQQEDFKKDKANGKKKSFRRLPLASQLANLYPQRHGPKILTGIGMRIRSTKVFVARAFNNGDVHHL